MKKLQCKICGKKFEGLTENQVLNNFNIHVMTQHAKVEASKPSKAESPNTHGLFAGVNINLPRKKRGK